MTQATRDLINQERQLYATDFVKQSDGYYQEYLSDEGLSEEEFLVVRMLVSNGESLIQRRLYDGSEPTSFELTLWTLLDSAISKMHMEDTTDVVFRVARSNFFQSSQIGSIVTFPAYMTASLCPMHVSGYNVEYQIQLAERTQARKLYRVYEVTPMLPEWQVEFPRGTRFHVNGIVQDGDKTIVSLTEIP